MVMLDFEVAHWGDPAFDPAFLLTHLVLKAVREPALACAFLDEAARFWSVYVEAAGPVAADAPAVVAELGCLLLARMDGKSPIEYLTAPAERDAVRALARALLAPDAPTTVDGALDEARRTTHRKDDR
jgi:5-methylthioribose kinase